MSELTIQDFDNTKGLHKWETGEIITAEDLNQNDSAILFLFTEELPYLVRDQVAQALEDAGQGGSSTAAAATIPTFDYIKIINEIQVAEPPAEGEVTSVYWDIYDDTLNYQFLARLYNTCSHIRCQIRFSSGGNDLNTTFTLHKFNEEIHCIAVFPSQTEELIFAQNTQPRGNIYNAQGVLLNNIIFTYQQEEPSL